MKNGFTLIQNKEDWDKFYFYKETKRIPHPKQYPCIAKVEDEDCGIMGSAWFHYVKYLPKDFQRMDRMDLIISMLDKEWKCIG